MNDAIAPQGTPALNAALAKFQAELPKVAKSDTATIPGKNGAAGFKYKYADLADLSAALLPVLGKNGLAFSAKPTMVSGEFGLAYALKHESGEEDAGFFPLDGRGTPQQIGSLITYARRYCLCAVTGVAPADEDDDASAAMTMGRQRQQTAGDAFSSAQPAPRANGTVSRPAATQRPAQAATPPAEDDALLAAWGAKVDEIATQDDADRADAELRELFVAKKIDATRANAIRLAIRDKATLVKDGVPA